MEDKALKIIFWISLVGVLFSGYLSYNELFRGLCTLGTCRVQIAAIPACVYGLVMYLAIMIAACFGLKNKNRNADGSSAKNAKNSNWKNSKKKKL